MRKKIVIIDSPEIPMIGVRAFGIIDMGTNIIEVRPTSICPLSCIFCSVNAGPKSKIRWCEYIVKPDLLIESVKEIVKYKNVDGIEIHIDGMGEPGTYPYLVDLIQEIKSIKNVRIVSMQTRLITFNERKILELNEAGLDRINLSIDALNPELAKKLTDTPWYDVNKVLNLVKFTIENTDIDVVLSPVWLPGINDNEIIKIIKWAIENKCGKHWPPVLIQKYISHKRGRKLNIKSMSWSQFYRELKKIEKMFGIKLIPSNEDFGIFRTIKLPIVYKVGEVIKVKIIERGIFRNEYLAIPINLKGDIIYDRVLTVIAPSSLEEKLIDSKVKVRVIENKHNIYIAELTV